MLIASPLRALMDLICLRKESWKGLAWLVEGVRIDPDALFAVRQEEIEILKLVYKHQQVQQFIEEMKKELALD